MQMKLRFQIETGDVAFEFFNKLQLLIILFGLF